MPCAPSPNPSPNPAFPFLRTVPYPSPAPPSSPHFSPTDRNALIRVSPDLLTCSASDGWRSIRCNTPIRQGSFYFEFEIEVAGASDEEMAIRTGPRAAGGAAPAVRVGVGRREATLGWPAGGDGYSYGFRDRGGEKVWMGKVLSYDERAGPGQGEGFRSGDVVGCWVHIPPPPPPSTTPTSSATPGQDFPSSSEPPSSSFAKQWQFDARSQPYLADVLPSPPADDLQPVGPPLLPSLGSVAPIPSSSTSLIPPDERWRIPIRYKNQLYFESRCPQVTKEMDTLMDPPSVSTGPTLPSAEGEPVVQQKKKGNRNRITNKTLPSSDEMLRASLLTPLRPLPTLPHSFISFSVNGVSLGHAFEDLLDFRPLPVAKEEKKRGRKGPVPDVDDGTLGYFPMVSCFGGGRVRLNPGPNFRFSPPSLSLADPTSLPSTPSTPSVGTTGQATPPPTCWPLSVAYDQYIAFQRALDEQAEITLVDRWRTEEEEEADRVRLALERDVEKARVKAEAKVAREAAKKAAALAVEGGVKVEVDVVMGGGGASQLLTSPSLGTPAVVASGLPTPSPAPTNPKKRSRSRSTGPAKTSLTSGKGTKKQPLPKSKLGVVTSIKPDPDDHPLARSATDSSLIYPSLEAPSVIRQAGEGMEVDEGPLEGAERLVGGEGGLAVDVEMR